MELSAVLYVDILLPRHTTNTNVHKHKYTSLNISYP